ncbi:MAG: DUF4258 domain-containing protein [Acidobacteria bacterium]|nr:DUF4258 domain-containing protein [Acidobacteriota bacterium]
MGELVKLDRARHIKRAKKRIKALLREGLVEYPAHAMLRLRERALDVNDVRCVLRRGRVISGGSHSFPETPRRYMLRGKGADGDDIVCVVDINGALVLVSAWPR